MPVFIMSLYRILPLVVALIAVAIVLFIIVFTTQGAEKAKEITLKVFWWLCAVGTIIFGVFTLYAIGDGREQLAWLFGSCLATMAILWLVDFVGMQFFKRKYQRVFYIIKARKTKGHKKPKA